MNIVLFIFISSTFANWGGSDSFGSHGTGGLDARGLDQIEIKHESLKIDLHNGFARVNVKYIMVNTGEAIVAKAGFPSFYCNGCMNYDDEKEHNIPWHDVLDYTIEVDKKKLAYSEIKGESVKWFLHESTMEPDYEPSPPGTLSSMPVYWLVSEIAFEKQQQRTITISYQNYYYSESGGYTDWQNIFTNSEFRYFLHTGASWKGPIQKGEVKISAVGVSADGFHISGEKRFVRKGNVYEWNFKNLEPTLEDNIHISFNNAGEQVGMNSDQNPMEPDAWYLNYGADQYFDAHFYTATASSCLQKQKYASSNVSDFKIETVWSEGVDGPGIGEKLELNLNFPMDLHALGIMAGHYKSKKDYYNNNRIARLRITVNGEKCQEYQLADEYHHFKGRDYRAYQFLELPKTSKPAKHIALEILEVYKGEKFDDTCISEILLRKKMKEKRNVSGGR